MRQLYTALTLLFVLVVAIGIFNVAYIARSGSPVAAPIIPRNTQTLGNGDALRYVILGDSTSIGQGAKYTESYAWHTAQYLAQSNTVYLTNLGVSGARADDVKTRQLPKVNELHPDIVLLAVGANDVTHLTSMDNLEKSLDGIITQLRSQNPNVKILVTGSPDMGTVSRFPWPTDRIATFRTKQVNAVYERLIKKYNLYFAPIAEKTGPAFAADPTLFAQDNFHPNARGYALWTDVLIQTLAKVRPN